MKLKVLPVTLTEMKLFECLNIFSAFDEGIEPQKEKPIEKRCFLFQWLFFLRQVVINKAWNKNQIKSLKAFKAC